MWRYILIGLMLFISLPALSQNEPIQHKYLLKTGAVYIGFQTNETEEKITIKTTDGNTLIISKKDIRKIKPLAEEKNTVFNDTVYRPVGFVDIGAGFNSDESELIASMYRLGISRGFYPIKDLYLGGGVGISIFGQNTLQGHTLMRLEASALYFFESANGSQFFILAKPGYAFNLSKSFRGDAVTFGIGGGLAFSLLNKTPFYAGLLADFVQTRKKSIFTIGFSVSVGI